MPAVHVIVHGLVQGVNFRMSAANEARRLGLTGWVRNLPDRTVETLASGAQEALEAYLRWLRHGPPGARVTRVDAQWREQTARLDSFEIRYGDD